MFLNYYEILGVAENATPDEVTKAYRRLAMKWHPDRYKGEDATEKMALINEAYQVLRDATTRAQYDCELARYKTYCSETRKPEQSSEAPRDAEAPQQDPAEKYRYTDHDLEEKIKQFRCKAKEFAQQSLQDLAGVSTSAAKEFASSFGTVLLVVVVLNLLFLLFFAIR